MKYILSIILSFLAGCLVIITIYNYKEEVVIEKQTIIENNTIKSAINNVYDSVLTILGYTDIDDATTIGSAFIYKVDDTSAYILTNYHVVKDLRKIEVRNNDLVIKEASILGFDEYTDVAVLKTDKEISKLSAILANSSNISLGDTVFTIGSPLTEDYYGTVTKGIISYNNRRINTKVNNKNVLIDAIQTSTTINPGNSGGPLCNSSGEVIGIISSKIIKNEVEGLGFAIPINDIKEILDKLENGQTIERIESDFEVINLNSEYDLYKNELYLDEDYEYGIYIKDINDSIFKDLKVKDIILKINNIEIKNIEEFEYYINKNEIVTLEVKRDNQIINLNFPQ